MANSTGLIISNHRQKLQIDSICCDTVIMRATGNSYLFILRKIIVKITRKNVSSTGQTFKSQIMLRKM